MDNNRNYVASHGDGAERILDVFNTILLVLGIIAAVVVLITGLAATQKPVGILFTILTVVAIVIGVLIIWAAVQISINISDNLREVKSILHRMEMRERMKEEE